MTTPPGARGGADGNGTPHRDRSPAVASVAVAVLSSVLAVGMVGARVEPALYVGAIGVVLLAYGAVVGVRERVGQGTVAVLAAITLAGVAGVGPAATVPATLCALLAWDAGGYGIRIGDQLGRSAVTVRAELVHAALTVAVGSIGALLAAGAYLASAGDQPTLAVALLFAGAAALAAVVGNAELTSP